MARQPGCDNWGKTAGKSQRRQVGLIVQPGQVSLDRSALTEPKEPGRQDTTERTLQQKQEDSWDRTTGTGLSRRNNLGRATRTKQQGQDSRDRISRTIQPGQVSMLRSGCTGRPERSVKTVTINVERK